LAQLDLLVSLDLYVNETNKYADYILPVTGMYERDDFPMIPAGMSLRPSIWATRAVIEPRGEARQEWEIVDEIARRMGLGGAYAAPELRELAAQGAGPTPIELLDMMLQMGAESESERFSFDTLVTEHPNGLALRDNLPVGTLMPRLRTPDGRIPLLPEEIVGELEHLWTDRVDDLFPLRLIGLREIQSQNSWMHNVERMMPEGRTFGARVHPTTAAGAGLADGDLAEIRSPAGSITIPVMVTNDVGPSTIAIPHGWGHDGGWRRANRSGGVNSNLLASGRAQDLERVTGMSVLNGIPVRLERARIGEPHDADVATS
jgi:formate dehydrogenase